MLSLEKMVWNEPVDQNVCDRPSRWTQAFPAARVPTPATLKRLPLMREKENHMRITTLSRCVAPGLVGLSLGACVSYGPAEVSRMSTYKICSTQINQGSGIAESSRRLLQSELERRKEGCASHRAAIQRARDDTLYDYMYGQQSP